MASFRSKGGRVLLWAARAAAWLFTAALGLFDVFMVREAVIAGYLFLRLGRHGFALADKLAMLVLGILWFVFMLYTQYTYGLHSDRDVSMRELRAKIVRVVAVEVSIILVAVGTCTLLR